MNIAWAYVNFGIPLTCHPLFFSMRILVCGIVSETIIRWEWIFLVCVFNQCWIYLNRLRAIMLLFILSCLTSAFCYVCYDCFAKYHYLYVFVFLKFPLLCHWKFVDYFQSRFCSQGPSIWPKVFENANLGLVWNVIFFSFTNIRMHKVFVEASKYYMCIYLKLTITVGAWIFFYWC